MITFVSLFGLDFGPLVADGALLTEVVFGIHGVGYLTYQALANPTRRGIHRLLSTTCRVNTLRSGGSTTTGRRTCRTFPVRVALLRREEIGHAGIGGCKLGTRPAQEREPLKLGDSCEVLSKSR